MTGTPSQGNSGWRRLLFGRYTSRTMARALVLGLAVYLALRYVALPVRLRGPSMEPTLHNGSIHIANLLRYARSEPQRGDVVVIAMTGNRAFYLKRVVGLPGERIAFSGGVLKINGQAVKEDYVRDASTWTMPEMTIASHSYFVAGDNRAIPMELHTLGTVDRSKIRGGLLF
jgi:signal peptidase I